MSMEDVLEILGIDSIKSVEIEPLEQELKEPKQKPKETKKEEPKEEVKTEEEVEDLFSF